MTATLDTPNAVLDRVSLVLDTFEGNSRLTLAEIVRRTGLPRSSAHRMLERLVNLRWLRRTGRDYELGMRLVELGSLAVHQDGLHEAALPFLHELHQMTGFVVHLAVLDGPDVVYLEKIGDRLGRAVPTRVGGRHPAHCTAIGKALLAHTPSAELPDTFQGGTRFSIASAKRLGEELAKVRAHGVALEREEALPRFGCIATPIGVGDEVVAAISLCGPVDKMQFDHRLAAPLRMAALGIQRAATTNRNGHHALPTMQQRRPPQFAPHRAAMPVA